MELTPKAAVGDFRERIQWMTVVVILGMGLLWGRLVWLQWFDGARWTRMAEDNVLRRIDLPSTRGIIRDARGRVIATNRPSYNVYVTPSLFRIETFPRLAEYLGLNRDDRDRLEARITGADGPRRFQQVMVRQDIDRESLALIETHRAELAGVTVMAVPIREYPFGELAAHAVGFMNEVNAEDLTEYAGRDYRPGERIGRTGIEKAWESILRGRRGWVRMEHDALGLLLSNRESIRTLGPDRRQDPVPGQDLVLSLDMELMRALDRAFRAHPAGAAAIVDVHTGRVMALYSKPSIDPNLVTIGLTQAQAREIDENPFHPRIDKSIYENYFPGSTFKPFTALAALEAGLIDPRATVTCEGRILLGRKAFRCTHVHGPVDLNRAIIESCNVYFFTVAETVTMDRIARMAFEFGLGHRTGIGINQESPGFIPTRGWYAQHYPGQFRIGHTLNTAIGQGNTKVTVLQLAMAYAALANGGTLYVPQIVERVEGPDGTVIQTFPPSIRRQVAVSPAHLALIDHALEGVVTDPLGTAHGAMIPEVPFAGKTGTAQVSRILHTHSDPRSNAYATRDHAWFAGYAPVDHPEVAFVVLAEHAGYGARESAPVVASVLRDYFTRIRPGAPIPSVAAMRAQEALRTQHSGHP